ncbi:MAG: HpcH/HpaI aldolase/citrate lyase family protein [Betaproteobacteria bacterium]|jgi:4-hydroxy-2-oxoheptanedioate aldolase|nr:MAG: HpcH/HpaI aldolase/citrate lyase family protein [Betaproteobacteria bacterium]
MEMIGNRLKQVLVDKQLQVGCWLSLGSHTAAEICASAGFDWVLIDMEHAPNDVPQVLHLLHAAAAYPSSIVVRAYWNDTVLIKRLLDLGVQSLLVPNVQTVEEAKLAVEAVRYPPRGVRGVSANSRSNRFGRIKDYFQRANDEVCLMVQIETRQGLDNLEAIAAVDGIDGLFIGPQDLAADLGHLGNPGHVEVRAAMGEALRRIDKAGKVPGILAFAEADAKHWISEGARFVAVTGDAFLLARSSEAVVKAFKR